MTLLRNLQFRSIVYQGALIAVLGVGVWYFVENALHNLQARGVATGFRFLASEAGISIPVTPLLPQPIYWLIFPALLLAAILVSMSFFKDTYRRIYLMKHPKKISISILIVLAFSAWLISWKRYDPSGSFGLILATGMINTIKTGAVAAVGAIILGFLLGAAQFSTNWLLRSAVTFCTELLRNVPLLLHVLFWYSLILNVLPPVKNSLSIVGTFYVSNRGIYLPTITGIQTSLVHLMAIAAIAVIVTAIFRRKSIGLGAKFASGIVALALALATMSIWQFPVLKGFNFIGGTTLSPEYSALVIGLVVYYSAFIADIVRSAIRSISHGQWEGSSALGLTRPRTIRLVIIPQAMRVVVPPLSNQMLGLAKDTSIGVAIAFPELVAISRTVINQTGQALEVMFVVMAFYLFINFAISTSMNLYNEKVRIVER